MSDYSQLIEVMKILREKALEAHRRNMRESERLAEELAQIDTLRNAVQADQASIGARQLLGADALYQSWLLRKRAEILRQAATIRILAHESLEKARDAWSRVQAVDDLMAEENRQKRLKQLARQSDALEEINRLRPYFTEG